MKSVATAVFGALVSTNAGAGTLLVADAETGDLSQTVGVGAYGCCSYSVTVATNPVRAGKYSYKMDARATDPPVAGANHRAEVQVGGSVMGEHWYGLSIYIPADWQNTSQFHLLTQWHVNTAMQPLQLVNNGSSIMWQHWYGYGTVGGSGSTSNSKLETLWTGDFNTMKGKWTDFVVHANWQTDSSGYIQIWKDGAKVVDWHPTNICSPLACTGTYCNTSCDAVVTPNGGSVYWHAGFNYYAAESRVMYVDEMRMGDATATYNQVDPARTVCPVCPTVPAPIPTISCTTQNDTADIVATFTQPPTTSVIIPTGCPVCPVAPTPTATLTCITTQAVGTCVSTVH